jgi:hypothetical protein
MSTNLYEEAIAEAKQLKDLAEQNARNQIIDAMTPKIRNLVESALLGETHGGDHELDDLDAMALALPDEEVEMLPAPVPLAPLPDETIELDLDALEAEEDTSQVAVTASGDVNITVETDDEDAEEEDLLLSQSVAEALSVLVKDRKPSKNYGKLKERYLKLRGDLQSLKRLLEGNNLKNLGSKQRKMVGKFYTILLRETISLKNDIILIGRGSGSDILQNRTSKMIKEMKLMSKRRSNRLFNQLFEDRQILDEVEATLALAPTDEDEAGELEDLLGDLEVSFEVEEAEEDEGGGEGDEEEGGEEELELELDEMIEIDEGMLRRELRRMRRIAEQTAGADDPGQSAPAEASVEDELFVDVDEDSLLNALADELGDAPAPSVGPTTGEVGMPANESRRRRRRARASRVNESRKTRALQRKLLEYKKAVVSLRQQLTEMNLFNAKLLYANKLMQNRNVTAKQQRAVVEALDNAKTLREAKLLYKSLTNSLDRKPGNRANLSESRVRRTLGSSSRSTQSGSPANSGVEVDRWAVLAGLNKDN